MGVTSGCWIIIFKNGVLNMTIEIGILLLVFAVWAVAPTYIAVIISYRLSGRMLAALERLQRTQSMVIRDLIALRTRTDTGDTALANQQLIHSNAHDTRMNDMPWTPPMDGNEEVIIPQGPHISPEIMFGDDDTQPPFPGEEA